MTEAEAIRAGHPPVAEKVACVDFDSTLFPFGGLMEDHDPLPGAAEAVRALKAAGYTIVIFTSRLSPAWWESAGMHPVEASYEQVKYIRTMCEKYDIPADYVTAEKVPAEVYFDDKAVRVSPEYPLLAAAKDFLGLKPITYGFPASYGYGKRWHVAVEKTVTYMWSNQTYLKTVALCQKDNHYSLGLDRFTESHIPPQPLCRHCERIMRKESANAA